MQYYRHAQEICAEDSYKAGTPGFVHRPEGACFIFARRSWEERVRRTSAFASLQPFERSRKQGHGCVSEDGLVLERRCSPAAVERAKASGSDAVVRRLVRYYQGQIDRAVAAATE